MTTPAESTPTRLESLDGMASAPTLLAALIARRSRRFGAGFRMNGGPLAYTSAQSPQPLSQAEEAALAFAACGITGPTLADLPYQTGDVPEAGSGNILSQLVGRTVPSGDAIHSAAVFVINDGGAWMLRRPQDYPRAEIADLARMAREHKLSELYERARVRVAAGRVDVPRKPPYTPPFNKWSANQPGSTYFLPVGELSQLYINIMLSAFDEEFGYYMLDERNRFKPAGIGRFARSKGGHLYDDPQLERVGTVGVLETWLCEFVAIEIGAMLQNLALMAATLGLGGFPHFATHPFGWTRALGFRMQDIPISRTIAAGPLLKMLLKLLKRDLPLPTALGLECDGATLLKPFCPPYYANMEQAVLAYVDYKYAQGSGTLRDGGANTAWRDGAAVQAGIPRYSDQAIAATIAYCDYIYQRYGRFPANNGPFRTVLAYQAHHLDDGFYAQFYREGSQHS